MNIHDRETVAHNILHNLQKTYTRESAVYRTVHKGLLKLANKELDALYTLSLASRKERW